MAFIPLHIYSAYSFLQSGFTMDRLVSSLRKKQYQAAGLTDKNVMFGIPEFVSLTQKYGIKPVVGMDVEINGDLFTLFAKNENGYFNLCKLTASISQKLLTIEFFKENVQDLIVILSVRESHLPDLFLNNQGGIPAYLLTLSKFAKDFFLGIENYDLTDEPFVTFVRDFASTHKYHCVAFPFIKYEEKGDAIVYSIVRAIATDSKLDIDALDGPNFLYSESQVFELYTGEEVTNTEIIAKSCDLTFSQKRGQLLKFPLPPNETADGYLEKLSIDGLFSRGLPLDDTRYFDRLRYELSVIKDMGYSNYFLIVRDYVNFAKDNGISVGPGRGSAAGSLVSYVLGITEVDPLKYDLLFERFLNPERKSMPDIDIDFSDVRRGEVVEYLHKKYGTQRVANIVTFQTIAAKQSLRDIGRVFDFPERDIDMLSKMLTDNKTSLRSAYKNIPALHDLVDSDQYYLNIVKLASKIEGLIRQNGLHAAGIVLNDTPISAILPVIYDNGNLITQYEMNYLEEQGFLKMDLLGLRNLTIVDNCVDSVNKNHGTTLKAVTLPFDDPKIFSMIASGRTMGLFQLESSGMKKAIKELAPNSFNDVVALLALFRPGPMDNIPSYALRKDGKEKVTYINPDLKDILAPTYGIIVYQEQIMQIAVKMAGFSLADADSFRRAISKKDAEKLAALQKAFVSGAVRKGYNDKHAESVFNHIYKFADYGFNKSHSVSYAILACQMGYLKAYYPAEFYASILETSSGANDTKFNEYISEIKEQNIHILPPDINLSGAVFTVENEALLFPLSAIRGVPNGIVKAIIEERKNRPFKGFFEFVERLFAYKISANHISHLIDAGSFDKIEKSRASLNASIASALQFASMLHKDDGQMPIDLSFLPQPAIVKTKDDPLENLNKEYEVIGIMVSDSPLRYKKDQLKAQKVVDLINAKSRFDTINIAGILKSKKVIKTKKGVPMAFITIYDETAEMEIVIFPNTFAESAPLLEKNATLLLTGHCDKEKDGNFIADKIRLLED